MHSSHPPPRWWRGAEPFFKTFLYEGLRSNKGFGWELTLECEFWIFFRWDLKTLCIKNSECKSQAKKNDSNCNFCNFSLLLPYPNKFLVVCICILIFHGIYPPNNHFLTIRMILNKSNFICIWFSWSFYSNLKLVSAIFYISNFYFFIKW